MLKLEERNFRRLAETFQIVGEKKSEIKTRGENLIALSLTIQRSKNRLIKFSSQLKIDLEIMKSESRLGESKRKIIYQFLRKSTQQ